MTLQLLTSKASRRKAEMSWNTTAKTKNYYRPTTREQCMAVRDRAILEIDGYLWVLEKPAENGLRLLVETIYEDPAIESLVMKETVRLAVVEELKQELCNREKNVRSKRAFSEVLEQIEYSLDEQINDFEFFFPVEGMSLKNVSRVDGGVVELFLCDSSICNQLASNFLGDRTSENSDIYDHLFAAFEEDFLNRVLIRSTASGDIRVAEKRAYRQAREFINYLRFAICFLIHERVTEQIVRINLSVEAPTRGELFLSRKLGDNRISETRGRGRDFLQEFIIDENRLKNLSRGGLLKDFASIVKSSSPTEIELLILTAIHWIGEAQNEFDFDVAFVKYWTALEAMFTGSQNPTQAVSRGVSRLTAYTSYRFIEGEEAISEVKTDISKLYDKRSDIIHRGMRHAEEISQGVSASDVSRLCKYTVWSIFSLFELRGLCYTNRSEIAHRLSSTYPPSVSEDLIDAARRLDRNFKADQPLRCRHLISDRWRPRAKS